MVNTDETVETYECAFLHKTIAQTIPFQMSQHRHSKNALEAVGNIEKLLDLSELK